MGALTFLRTWWQSLPLPWRAWRVVGYVPAGDEVPERLPHKGVVLVGVPDRSTWAVFDCPCRTGHRLMVNLDKGRRPAWDIEHHRRLTIRPSIDDVTPERRCHFLVRRGRITWASDDHTMTQMSNGNRGR